MCVHEVQSLADGGVEFGAASSSVGHLLLHGRTATQAVSERIAKVVEN